MSLLNTKNREWERPSLLTRAVALICTLIIRPIRLRGLGQLLDCFQRSTCTAAAPRAISRLNHVLA